MFLLIELNFVLFGIRLSNSCKEYGNRTSTRLLRELDYNEQTYRSFRSRYNRVGLYCDISNNNEFIETFRECFGCYRL